MPKFAIHITLLLVLTALIALGIAYPFLSGNYDRLAMPVSTMIQVLGLAGIALVPVGVLWLTMPKYRFGFALTALIISAFAILVISTFATLSVGKSLGVLVLLLWAFIVILLHFHNKIIKKSATKQSRLSFEK